MNARKLNKNNFCDLVKAYRFAACGETIRLETGTINPHEYAGYTAASMIPGLNDADCEVICEAVNEAVEKAAQGDPDPESVLLFEIPDYADAPHLVVIELFGYVPTSLTRNRGYWTSVHGWLVRLEG